jgi:hypothetical protein
MTACKPVLGTSQQSRSGRQDRQVVVPPLPDPRLWKTDRDRAFEAGVRWFLAIASTAQYAGPPVR